MILPDVNVLVLAHRKDQDDHPAIRRWLEAEVNSDRPFALADARGNLVPDAHLAAIAIEHGATVATRDGDSRGSVQRAGSTQWLTV